MTDRQKVINGLNCCCHTDGSNCAKCPYDIADSDCTALMSMDVLELLKEQKAVEPKVIGTNSFGYPVHVCGKCGLLITESMNYCYECGRKVKWDG